MLQFIGADISHHPRTLMVRSEDREAAVVFSIVDQRLQLIPQTLDGIVVFNVDDLNIAIVLSRKSEVNVVRQSTRRRQLDQ